MSCNDLLTDILKYFHDFIKKENYNEDGELKNILSKIEKLNENKNNCNDNEQLIKTIVHIFISSTCRKELVICLSTALTADVLKCCDCKQIEKLLQWMQEKEESSQDLECLAAKSFLYANVILSDALHGEAIAEDYLSEKNLSKIVSFYRNSTASDLENLVKSLHLLDVLTTLLIEKKTWEKYLDALEEYSKALLDLHYEKSYQSSNPDVRDKFIFLSFCLISKAVALSPAFGKAFVSEILGFIRAYWQYDVSKDSILQPITKVLPSQQYFQECAEETEDLSKQRNPGGKVSKLRKPKTVKRHRQNAVQRPNDSLINCGSIFKPLDLKTSESETSDNDLGNANKLRQKRHQKLSKIRLYALALLEKLMISQDRSLLYSYWHALFPSGLFESNVNILVVAQQDSNSRCRCAALQVAAQFLYASKTFLMQAESLNKPLSYMPFSLSLALDIVALYDGLFKILEKESYIPVLIQALKCLSLLVQGTPFHQMESGLAKKIIQNISTFLKHRDSTIQVASLMVVEFLVPQYNLTEEVSTNLGFPTYKKDVQHNSKVNNIDENMDLDILVIDDEELEEELQEFEQTENHSTNRKEEEKLHSPSKSKASYWALKFILANIRNDSSVVQGRVVPPSVRIASLKVLTALIFHFHLFFEFLEGVEEALRLCLEDPSYDVNLSAARCIDSLAYQISKNLSEKPSMASAYLRRCKDFWARILPLLQNTLNDEKERGAAFKVAICDAISNMGEKIYESQPSSVQMTLISFLSGIAMNEEESLISSAALRALAVFSQFESLRKDFVFIENVAEMALRLRQDSNILVKIKAIWSLASISDITASNVANEEDQSGNERLSDDLLFRQMEAALEDSKGNDKIRANAVRSLGNLIRSVSSQHMANPKYKNLVHSCIEKLIESLQASGTAKVKWNSCYAIRNLISNKNIFQSDLAWQESLYLTLCSTIVNHQNFKVRTNATTVITNIQQREYFGSFYESFWLAILDAIEQTNHLDNYMEYNHRDQLQEQLCLAIVHLINLARKEDLTLIANNLSRHKLVVSEVWRRVIYRILPEKSSPFLVCVGNFQKRFTSNDQHLTQNQKHHIESIYSILKVD